MKMNIDSKLLKEFAQITNDSEVKTQNTYLRGTIVTNSGGKYVQLDGSTTATPISEVVNVEEGDRVLVSIENHKATIIGNFTFPPSARKEQEALDQAGAAQESANNANTTANIAQEKAQEASSKADTAISQSSIASASADEAKQQANDAIATANTASTNASEAKTLATQASTEASEAKTQAAESQTASANAQAEVTRLQNEVTAAQEDADKALSDLATQADEISSIKETYATKVEVGNTKAELETTITTKVGELETTVSQTYSTKTENVELEEKLQSQITQNAEGIASQVTKTEQLESDTAQAQLDVAEALSKANAAQTAADNAQATASDAQTAASNAQTAADEATQKATTAQNAADLAQQAADAADEAVQAAQSDLNEAKENLANVTSRVDATETDIADAQAKVDAAQTSVNEALADAAEANLAATKAQEAADKAQQDAEIAQGAATTAQQKADNAQTAADNAQAAADKAQEDVAALTSRVTTAETTISQNSENITLNANKITEIGNQADTTDQNLTNNYYTKTETDAKIQVESDRITSTVSKVETVEKNAITSTVEEFYLSTSPTELSGGSWSTSQPTWTEGKYIWRRNFVTKGDGTTSYQPSQNGVCITGNTGATGATGTDGRGITSTTVTYQGSTSGTTIPTGTWSESIPTVAAGSYLWTRTVTEYTSGNPTTAYSVGKMGNTGSTGATGADGRGITDAVTTYQASSDGTIIPTGTWSSDVPTTTAEQPYLWTRTITTYTDDTTTTAYAIGATPEGVMEEVDMTISNVEDNLDSRLNEVNKSIETAQSTIDQLSNMISHLVTDANGESLMTQTSDGWTFNMSSINDNLTTIKNTISNMENNDDETNSALERLTNLVNDVVNKTAYIVMSTDDNGDPCIELGKSDNPFKVRITNTAIDFLEGSMRIAYANNNTFYTEKMIVKNELQIGETIGFVWKTRPNGNMGLSPIKA